MKRRHLLYLLPVPLFFLTLVFNACNKGSAEKKTSNPCAGITITVSGTAADADAGISNGSITATASGSTGFIFSLNSGTAQASGTFSNLAAGSYTITAKNANGCSGSSIVIVGTKNACMGAPGADFNAVKTIIIANCAVTGCHNGTQAPDYTADCTIVDYGLLIKQRSVDDAGTADQMPQPPRAALAQADRDKITAWINAGGRITD